MAPATSLQILAGDFNAEFGNNHNPSVEGHETVGCSGGLKLTSIGREWRQWFSRFSLRDLWLVAIRAAIGTRGHTHAFVHNMNLITFYVKKQTCGTSSMDAF